MLVCTCMFKLLYDLADRLLMYYNCTTVFAHEGRTAIYITVCAVCAVGVIVWLCLFFGRHMHGH